MNKKEELLKAVEKGKAEVKERKTSIRYYKKEIERLTRCLQMEEYGLGIAEKIISKLEKELKNMEGV